MADILLTKKSSSSNPTDPSIPRIFYDNKECCYKSYIYIWREKIFLGRFRNFEDAEEVHNIAYDKMGYFDGNHDKFMNFILEKFNDKNILDKLLSKI